MPVKLYTYTTAARELGLSSRAVIWKRMSSLAKRGEPLTEEAGELMQVGERLLLTDSGLSRLASFTPRQSGRKRKEKA